MPLAKSKSFPGHSLFAVVLGLVCIPLGGKGPVAAKAGAASVGGHNSKMIKVPRTQASDVGSDRPGRIPSLGLHRGGVPVAGCRAPLEIDSRSRPTRID
jgi:hypothetical protein